MIEFINLFLSVLFSAVAMIAAYCFIDDYFTSGFKYALNEFEDNWFEFLGLLFLIIIFLSMVK